MVSYSLEYDPPHLGYTVLPFCQILSIRCCSFHNIIINEFLQPIILHVGFNPVQKLPAYEFLNKENKQCESITHKTHMHRDFSLDPKTGTTSLIFHYFPFNVTIHIYTCRSIQYHGPKNHRVQYHVRKIMHKTIGRFAQPNIWSKNFFSRGAAPDPVEGGCPPPLRSRRNEGGLPPPSNPPFNYVG